MSPVEGQEEEKDPIEALGETIPGAPGEDYPIFAFPPETSFVCDGKIQGYYADPEADCQAFHVCANLALDDDLTKYSLLCPNGTLFNQQYFICDWWFNVDCSQVPVLSSLNDQDDLQAEDFYSLNADVKAAGEAATEAARNGREFPDVEGLASERQGGRRAQG